ncbi:hook-length control protein FliK [Desulfonispora thiosulfatigenes DSM 11270]|uniref:Hook-length control protein FliK n=1 Tax=Desulfonispora thiosulfatigenes DSM 11270 TaxID=656914 RepID=A0A1W1UMT6_DESTI|nr:flagellar hook-length control protein FliK [Desulfonispora thiosulfatigenes]SMB82448.1 hook-length control protein FliK [Desulfonispora thiosulfatigenes DSM 11270]
MRIAAILPRPEPVKGTRNTEKAENLDNQGTQESKKNKAEEMPFGEVMQQMIKKGRDESDPDSESTQVELGKTKFGTHSPNLNLKSKDISQDWQALLSKIEQKNQQNNLKTETLEKLASESQVLTKKAKSSELTLQNALAEAGKKENIPSNQVKNAGKSVPDADTLKQKSGEVSTVLTSVSSKMTIKESDKESQLEAKEKQVAGDKVLTTETDKTKNSKKDFNFKEELQNFEKSKSGESNKDKTTLSAEKISLERNEFNLKLSETAKNNMSKVLPEQTLEQIVDKFKVMIEGKQKTLEVHLRPESLGKVKIELQSLEGIVTAKIIAENSRTASLLGTNIQQIKENLESQGIKVQNFGVNVGSEGQGRFTGQENQSNNRRPSAQTNYLGIESELVTNPEVSPDSTNTRLDILA